MKLEQRTFVRFFFPSTVGEYIYMKKCSVRAPARAHSTFEKSKNHDFGVFYCNLEVNLQNILARSARGSARAPKKFQKM